MMTGKEAAMRIVTRMLVGCLSGPEEERRPGMKATLEGKGKEGGKEGKVRGNRFDTQRVESTHVLCQHSNMKY